MKYFSIFFILMLWQNTITNKERYNQVIDAWTHVNTDLGNILMKEMTEADQGFNAVYMMKNWSYMLMTNCNANNLNLTIALNRTSTDNQLFPRRGSEVEASVNLTPPWSEVEASVNLTPPWSAFDNKDYKNLANDSKSPTYSALS